MKSKSPILPNIYARSIVSPLELGTFDNHKRMIVKRLAAKETVLHSKDLHHLLKNLENSLS